MTLVLGTVQHVGGPQAHVLIIGVGRYPYLSGGSEPTTPGLPLLGQLKSPPVSARKIADWFTSGTYLNPAVPLGSVEMLLSDANGQQYAPGGGPPLAVEDATMMSILRAFNDWYDRCNANPGNLAFFYFCGHGLQRDATILLPEDFAQNPNNPWLTAIDFDRTYRGMEQCTAQTQFYVIDACRNWSTSMLQDLDVQGQTLKRTILGQQKQRTAPRLFATANGLPAFGDTGGVSRLTSALIECLNGSGAERQNGQWSVLTSSLGEAVQKLVNIKNADLLPQQRQTVDPAGGDYSVGTRVLNILANGLVPQVLVTFCCLPDAATGNAHFYYQRKGLKTLAPVTGPWTSQLPAGVYDFGVLFGDGGYAAKVMPEEFIRPPSWPITLETQEV